MTRTRRSGAIWTVGAIGSTVAAWLALATVAAAQDPLVTGQVYDANGLFVGTLIGYTQGAAGGELLREIDGDVVQLSISNTGDPAILPQGQTVWFSGTDCTGQAYAAGPNVGTAALAGVLAGAGNPNVYYFAPAGTVSVLPAVLSRAFFAGGCSNDPGTLPPGLFPVIVSPDPLVFTVPFVVETFRPILAQPAAVPGLERWGLVGLGIALSMAAVVVLRRWT
jgi:hypothetical protein